MEQPGMEGGGFMVKQDIEQSMSLALPEDTG